VFTARYALSPYIKQIRFVFKGLKCVVKKYDQTAWTFIWLKRGRSGRAVVSTLMNLVVAQNIGTS
jgi:hypothetical protein